ncbi:glycosyltransferase family 2 protein [Marinobacter sp. MIT932201]|uniref:glycosyltransferase family 2 protein n=1 Tax=Marinobacter sp. MIT932201 TaxID=3096995 RepID=UPI00399B54EC
MLTTLFWLSLLILVYVYAGYPLLVRLLSLLKMMPVQLDDSYRPSVSIVIAAYNESADIENTLDNKLKQDYPLEKMEILVVSDESDDGTDEIIERKARDSECPIKLIRQVPRQGKTAGLNTLIAQACGEIILFSDANSQWDKHAVARLVSNFADPDVGYVTGKMVYVNEDGSLVGDGCSAYMKYENWLREHETHLGSIVGVDGGIDAMRKALHVPLRPDQLPDFVQPLKVIEQGYRVVYEPRALLKENTNEDSGSEFSMRVRVGLRALWALKDMSHLMNPVRFGMFSFQLISHKLLRYLAFIPLVILSMTALLLSFDGGIYTVSFLGLVALYVLGWIGARSIDADKKSSAFYSVPYYFLLLNFSSFKATAAFLRGEKKVIWKPRKG